MPKGIDAGKTSVWIGDFSPFVFEMILLWPSLGPCQTHSGRHFVNNLLPMTELSNLIPTHGGYRKLKRFQVAQLCYDLTVRFCDRYVDRFSLTKDQMVQAARSGVQNIAEGSQASATSKKTELKLTQVARASLEELRLDYEDFLRPQAVEAFAEWVVDERKRRVDGHRLTRTDTDTRTMRQTSVCP